MCDGGGSGYVHSDRLFWCQTFATCRYPLLRPGYFPAPLASPVQYRHHSPPTSEVHGLRAGNTSQSRSTAREVQRLGGRATTHPRSTTFSLFPLLSPPRPWHILCSSHPQPRNLTSSLFFRTLSPPQISVFSLLLFPGEKKDLRTFFFAILLSLHRLSVLIYSFLSKLAFLLGFFGSLLSRLRRFLSPVSATGPIHPPTRHHSPRNNPRTISSDRVLLTPAPIDWNLRNLEVK